MDAERWVTSPHLGRFTRRQAVFVYHDLWGYLLEMSADLVAFIDGFGSGATVAEVMARPALREAGFSEEDARGFVRTLAAHDVLLPLGAPSGPWPRLADAWPLRARWRVAYTRDDGVVEVVQGRAPESPRRVVSLSGWRAALWHAIDGQRTCREIADDLQERGWAAALAAEPAVDPAVDPAAGGAETTGDLPAAQHGCAVVCREVAAWTHSERQWLRVSSVRPSLWARMPGGRPAYLDSTMPYPRLGDDVHDPFDLGDGLVATQRYHTDTVADAEAQFEDVETTLSHLFRHPHAALQGRTFGGATFDALREAGVWRGDVLEIGGGLGWFARGLLERAATLSSAPASYTLFDLAPALQEAQRARLADQTPPVRFVLGDAEELPLPPASVDLVVSNEVIADLSTAWVDRDAVDDRTPGARVAERWQLPLHDAPERFALNVGAYALVERLWHVLRPGGAAWLTEFGHRSNYPVESTHLDHPEFSIHFGHVAHVASQLGFEATIIDVPRFVGLDSQEDALRATRTWWINLRFLAAEHGVTLDKRAWTRQTFAAALGDALPMDQLEALHWQPLEERTMGLVPGEFLGLLLRKPDDN